MAFAALLISRGRHQTRISDHLEQVRADLNYCTTQSWVLRGGALAPAPQARLGEALTSGILPFRGGGWTRLVRISSDGTGISDATLQDIARRHDDQVAHEVTSHLLFDTSEFPLHEAVARFAIVRRQRGIEQEQFADHWVNAHAPLVMSRKPLFTEYRASVPVRPERLHPWGGFLEQYFPDVDTWLEHDRQVVEDKPEIAADLADYVDGICQYMMHDLHEVGRS